ncbi:MAG: hypothetical protein IEMM0003_0676 [bacterium]|nr:MAG: hypothetical protein IEMM0003_0676 [bacterium]
MDKPKKQRNYRFSCETLEKIEKLKSIYKIRSENELIRQLIDDIYDIKQTKALVPFEDLDARDKELKQAFFQLGKLQGVIEEKDKLIDEMKLRKRGFFARLFGVN